jgi:hypothetical protein
MRVVRIVTGNAQLRTYTVPRRFGMGAIMAWVTISAIVLAVLPRLNTPTIVYLFFATLVVSVSLGQMFASHAPRLISVIAGAICLPAVWFAQAWWSEELARRYHIEIWTWQFWERWEFWYLLQVFWQLAIMGAIAGYFAGTLAASVFLFSDMFSRWRMNRQNVLPTSESKSFVDDVPYYSPDSCAPYLGAASTGRLSAEGTMTEHEDTGTHVKKLGPPVGVPVFNCRAYVSARREDGLVHARAAELSDLRTSGTSEREALQHLVGAFKIIMAQCLSEGRKIPFLAAPHPAEADEQERFIAVHL